MPLGDLRFSVSICWYYIMCVCVCICQIVCRSSAPLNHDVKVKISNFCHVTEQRVCIHLLLMSTVQFHACADEMSKLSLFCFY